MLLLQDSSTALHYACGFGYTEVVQHLLTNGANLSATNKVNHKTIFLLIVCLKLQNVMSCEFSICSYIQCTVCTHNHMMMNE